MYMSMLAWAIVVDSEAIKLPGKFEVKFSKLVRLVCDADRPAS